MQRPHHHDPYRTATPDGPARRAGRAPTPAPTAIYRRRTGATWFGFVLAVASLIQLAACGNPPWPRGSLEQLYPEPAQRPALHTVGAGDRQLQVASMPGQGTTPIVFVHGSPGGWQAWARFLDDPALAHLGPRIAMDRPGFGGSADGGIVPDLRRQAALLATLIPPGKPAIVVGHSLGAPLIAWMAIDHPDKVCAGLMVSGSMAPELEAPRWYNRLADNRLARRVLSPAMQLSNDEMMVLREQLHALDAELPSLNRPFVALQGGDDPLVDPRTADYLERRAPARWMRVVRMPAKDHFILWREPRTVIREILALPCGAGG